jgi:hypothetical protein
MAEAEWRFRMALAYFASHHRHHRKRRAHSPLFAPLLAFTAATALALGFVAYVLWPRWPDVPVALDAPALPIVVAGTSFSIEPAAIRMRVQRRPGTHDRVDLAYVWPNLTPPDPLQKSDAAPVERMFVTIQGADGTLPPMQRVETIYPRYLVPAPVAGPPGLTLRGFRDDTPYRGEELVFDSEAPAHFLARCSKRGAVGPGHCLLDRRIGEADITIRFSREWLTDWRKVADGIDALMARIHPN